MPDLANGTSKAIFGGLMGGIICLILNFAKQGDIKHGLLPNKNRFVLFTIGKIPKNRTFKENSPLIPKEFSEWFDKYKSEYPVHAKLFEHVAAIIHGHPEVPASPVPGGHGGASLEVHSWNVLREALENQEKWTYQGSKTKRGLVSIPVYDANYRFYPDPLIPLSAFCHDVGKIVCYKTENGVTKEIKPRHDEEGAKLVAALPEFQELSFVDQEDLVTCLGFYHHHRSIPLHVLDRSRALTEFLLVADVLAGKMEGETVFETDHDHDLDEPVVVAPLPEFVEHLENLAEPKPKPGKKGSGKSIESQFEAGDESFLKAMAEARAIPAVEARQPENDSPPVEVEETVQIEGFKGIKRVFSKDRCTKAFVMFSKVCRQPGRLNAGASNVTIGRKYGSFCFVQEQNMRRAASQSLKGEWQEKMARENKEKHSPHEFTLAVMWALHDRGLLVREYENDSGEKWFVSPNNALFDIQWRDKTGGWVKKSACIVFKIENELADFLEIPDCAANPQIVKPLWASQQRQLLETNNPKD